MSTLSLNTGLKALLSAQYGLDTVGHNLANVNTPGYSRQNIQLGSSLPMNVRGLLVGSGVDAGQAQRSVDELLGRRILGQRGIGGDLGVRNQGLAELETLFGEPGENGLGSLLDGFFSGLSALTNDPADPILRAGALEAAQTFTDRLNGLGGTLQRMVGDTSRQVAAQLDEANQLAQEIADLNVRIAEMESGGAMANDLRDQRSMALESLGQLVDVQPVDGPNGTIRVLVSGNLLVSSSSANRLSLTQDAGGDPRVQIEGATGFVPVKSGTVGGLLELGGSLAPDYLGRLDRLAYQLALETNRVHSTGIPSGGPFSSLSGTNAVMDMDQDGRVRDELLSNAGLPFDVQAGSLFVNVTDTETGALSRHRIDISETHTTVQDFLDDLNDIPQLSADLDSGNRLRIRADVGFGFDFSARLDTTPDGVGSFGGTRASLGAVGAEPYALTPGDTLDLTTGLSAGFSITIDAADFAETSAATAAELAAVINADPEVVARGLTASDVGGTLVLQTLASGEGADFTVLGGSVAGALGWTPNLGQMIVGQTNGVEPELSGTYTGSDLGQLTFRPNMDGTIGTTDGLQVEVLDSLGNRVATLDVGAGYAPGAELDLGNGLGVRFGLGELSATNHDLFTTDLAPDTDSSDILVALGVNSFFQGSTASDLAVSDAIMDDPGKFAASFTGSAADSSLLVRLLSLEEGGVDGLEGQSLGGFYGDLVSDLGFESSRTINALESNTALVESLEERRQSISGVNVDEELVDLVAFEQAFEAASRYISVVNDLGREILNLL